MKLKLIGYWVATAVFALQMLVDGIASFPGGSSRESHRRTSQDPRSPMSLPDREDDENGLE